MVIGFAKDKLHMPEHELSQLAIDVREGDISVLLKEYEKEIKVMLELTFTDGNIDVVFWNRIL